MQNEVRGSDQTNRRGNRIEDRTLPKKTLPGETGARKKTNGRTAAKMDGTKNENRREMDHTEALERAAIQNGARAEVLIQVERIEGTEVKNAETLAQKRRIRNTIEPRYILMMKSADL